VRELEAAAPRPTGRAGAPAGRAGDPARRRPLGEARRGGREFEAIHDIERARRVGSVHDIIPAAELRPGSSPPSSGGWSAPPGLDSRPDRGRSERTSMNAFVLNRHGRMVFPSNIMPELDFSTMESLEQLDSVIRRDFETKAPERHRHPGAGPDRRLRQPLRPDARHGPEPVLGQPLLDHHVRQAADPLGGRAPDPLRRLPAGPGAVGGRRDEGRRRGGGLPGAAGPVGRRRRGPDLRDPVRRLRQPQAPRDDAAGVKPTVAEFLRAAGQPHLPAAALRPRLPGLRLRRHPRLRRGRARAGGAAPLGDGAAQPVPVGPVAGGAGRGRPAQDDDYVVAFHPGTRRCATSCAGCAAGAAPPAARAARGVPAAGRPYPAIDVRARSP
jgi:3-oxoacyl-[acyl-carrier-protein] synthase-3